MKKLLDREATRSRKEEEKVKLMENSHALQKPNFIPIFMPADHYHTVGRWVKCTVTDNLLSLPKLIEVTPWPI